MLVKTGQSGLIHRTSSDITPRAVYEGRRDLMKLMATGVAGAAVASWAVRDARAQAASPGKLAVFPGIKSSVSGAMTMEPLTSYKDITNYNNFYEFGTE
ncbi:MAG: protein-methionine-sulfoxide reductase catalytic subunit MsrP, partial [Rhodoferax sp.]